MKRGDLIPITINGVSYTTMVDEEGVQRLPLNTFVENLFMCGALDLNRLAVAVLHEKVCPQSTRRWVYLNLGFSVCGYREAFPKDRVVNPARKPRTLKTVPETIPAPLLDLWRSLCRGTISAKVAFRELLRMWKQGKPDGLTWPAVNPLTGLPRGLTYRALLRHVPRGFELRRKSALAS